MEILAILLMLGSALGVASHGTTQRWLLDNKLVSVTELLFTTQVLPVTLFLSILILRIMLGMPFKSINHIFWIGLFGSFAINIWIQYANARARRFNDGEQSLVGPVQSLTPGLKGSKAEVEEGEK